MAALCCTVGLATCQPSEISNSVRHRAHHHHRRDENSVTTIVLPAGDQDEMDSVTAEWTCPRVEVRSGDDVSPAIGCRCDLAHTLRCTGAALAEWRDIESIVAALRRLPQSQSVSLLDISVRNLSRVVGQGFFDQVSLHGLVISSGELVEVSDDALAGLASSLTALGLPNNRLSHVPLGALLPLVHLERLDLSNNRIHIVTSHSFEGLESLRFLDLSGNQMATIEPGAFTWLVNLRTLHLRSNSLATSQLTPASLRGLQRLQELDVSYNRLQGRLTAAFLQGLEGLKTLDLGVNNVTLLKRGMLSDLKRLTSLRLSYNQIDVIEDQAFVSLTALTTLDLSHNGIVSISGQSLSHLNNLTQLDLSHNYLRALTFDLVSGLDRLRSLDLTDNDISLVQSSSVKHLNRLDHLWLYDNPLTCDCHLAEFAAWLQQRRADADSETDDVRSAVCATPPSLENGLLVETSASLLTCGDAEGDVGPDASTTPPADGDALQVDPHSVHHLSHGLNEQPTEDFIRLSTAQVRFVSAQLENENVLHTRWNVNAATLPYTCDAILVYEISQDHQVLLDSYPVGCQSSGQPGANDRLQLSVQLSEKVRRDGQYRLCLVLFEGVHDDDASLLPGCSHSITWRSLSTWTRPADAIDQLDSTAQAKEEIGKGAFVGSETSTDVEEVPESEQVEGSPQRAQITAFYANVTAPNAVSVYLRMADADAAAPCAFTVVVFEGGRQLGRQRLNCSVLAYTFGQLPPALSDESSNGGEYQVCATFASRGRFLPPPDGYQRQADGDIILRRTDDEPSYASKSTASQQGDAGNAAEDGAEAAVQYSHCVVAKMPSSRVWAVENTLVVIAVTVVFVLVAAALLAATYLLARRVFFRRSKLLSSWSCSSSNPLSGTMPGDGSGVGGLPKTSSRHILYVPEADYFSDSFSSNSHGNDHREETSTNV